MHTNKNTSLTETQKELLELLNPNEIHDYFDALKKVHYLGTYCVQKDMVELEASAYVHNLLDVVQKLSFDK